MLSKFLLFKVLLISQALVFVSSAMSVETFDQYDTVRWRDGTTNGAWIQEYDGYGKVGIRQTRSGNKFLYQRPKRSRSLNVTHASLVITKDEYETKEIKLRSKVVKQLRTPVPNSWETAWVLWNYKHDHHFYYFTLKIRGWELGKVDNAKRDPNGPSCLWPKYLNCKYPGAQRYLRTGLSPTTKIGRWDKIRVVQKGNLLTVYADGKKVTQYRDTNNPYYSGSVGLYNEDASVRFDDVEVNSMELN